MNSAVCCRCIEDPHLAKIVKDEGRPAKCHVCQRETENAFDTNDFATNLDRILRRLFSHGYVEQVEDEHWIVEGEYLEEVIPSILKQTTGIEADIIECLIQNEKATLAQGTEAFFDKNQRYSENISVESHFDRDWKSVSEQLKHHRRFFNTPAAKLFRELFSGVEGLSRWNHETKANEPIVRDFPSGLKVFRARMVDSERLLRDVHQDPWLHVGPPPAEFANAGRMNARGVVAFYGATDLETCLAEVRTALGSDAAVISLETTRAIRILDFTRLESFYADPSYFESDYSEQLERSGFLRRLQRLISQPVIPGREQDYLITQTMTEYIAHVHSECFDGIFFESAQRAGGVNVVLFPDAENKFPLSYIEGSLQLHETTSIKYEHRLVSLSEDPTTGKILIKRPYDFQL